MTLDSPNSLEQLLKNYHKVAGQPSNRRDEANAGVAWLRFAAAAGASLAAASDADAVIQHVVPPSPIRVTTYDGVPLGINLDGVGGNDLRIGAGIYLATPTYSYRFIGSARGLGDVYVLGGESAGPYGNIGVHRFNEGDVIPAVMPSATGSILHVSATQSFQVFTYAGQFGVNGTGFAGFVNNAGGSVRAGWIKIRTEPSDFNNLLAVSVLEWAYEDVPGTSIMAGQTESLGVPGDYNQNGSVDAADYTVWRDHLGQTFDLPNEGAGISTGQVLQNDYTFWKSQFGNSGSGAGATGSASASSVPEPTTVSLGMLALGAAGIAALRRRPT